MTTTFEAQHPRGGNPGNTGQFSEKHQADPGVAVLAASHPQPEFSPPERTWLAGNAGVFADGYDESMIDRFASRVPSIKVACVWEYHDPQFGFGGSSELYGRLGDGPWRPFSGDANRYLLDGQPGDPVPARFLDDPDGLDLNLDTVAVMNRHNYTLHS